MASIRQGYLDDYSQNVDKVGIGTSISQEKLQVVGDVMSTGLSATGIATLTSTSGFIERNLEYVENVDVDAGDSATLSGEIIVGAGLTITIGTGVTAGQGNIDSLKVYKMFQPPTGGTNQRPSGKPGSLFYNTDFKTVEFFDGSSWRQIDNRSTSNRAVFAGSSGDAGEKTSEYINISSLGGTTTFFGTFANNFASGGRGYHGGCASETRGIIGGGWQPGTAYNNIDYFTVASAGDTIDFGDLQQNKGELDWCSSSTRGITAGGEIVPFANTNTIDYIQIATIGNALDFGDTTSARRDGGMTSSPIHGFLMGGITSSTVDTIDRLTISSTGNAIDFGSLTLKNYPDSSVVSNGVAGFIMGGTSPSTIETIDKFTFATGGNATVFGNLLIGRRNAAGASNLVRGLCAGGGNPAGHKVISYITMSSAGDALNFGDLSVVRTSFAGLSDCHGGLGGF